MKNSAYHGILHQRGRLAYDEALRRVPQRWYEPIYVPYIACFLIAFVSLQVTLSRYWFSPPIWLSLGAMLFMTVGWWIDTFSTHAFMKLKPAFDQRGMFYPAYEVNPLTRETPHMVLQILSPSTLFSLMLQIVVWFIPALGLAYGTTHIIAAWGNVRNARRMRLNLHIFDGLSGYDGGEADKKNGRETHSDVMLAGPLRLVQANRV